MLDIREPCLSDVLAIGEVILGIGCHEYVAFVIFREEATDGLEMSGKADLFLTVLFYHSNSQLVISILNINCEMLLSGCTNLCLSVSEQVQHCFVLNQGINLGHSRWIPLIFAWILIDSLFNMDPNSIKYAIKPCGKIIGIHHWIVSEHIDIHISPSHAGVLLVRDGDIHVKAPILKGKGLKKIKSK